MSYCSSCGDQIKNDASFCPKCGKAVDANIEKNSISAGVDINSSHISENLNEAKLKAEKLANQAFYVFGLMLLCEFKGADGATVINNPMPNILFWIVLAGLIYFLANVQGVNKLKPNFILSASLILAIFYVFALYADLTSGEYSNLNFFDWIAYVNGFLQSIFLFRAYLIIKKYTEV